MTLINEFRQKAEMNLESWDILSFFGFYENFDFYILIGQKKDNISPNEYNGLVGEMKTNQKKETASIQAEIRAI